MTTPASPRRGTPSFAERELSKVAGRLVRVAPEPSRVRARDFRQLCRDALASPVGSERVSELAAGAERVAVLISDQTRDEPREEMLDALFSELDPERVLIVVAAGTHAQADASVVPERYRSCEILVHDARRPERTTDLGRTTRGTRVRLCSQVVDTDLVVVTSRVRPHYFAGFSGGLKGVFPGVAYLDDALANHLLKAEPSARLGRVEDNVCRLDMEEAAQRLKAPIVALCALADVDGNPVAVSAGHPVAAHRALVGQARGLFSVSAPRSPVVVVADRPPVSRSLYQASKMIPPAGALLEPGGTVIVVAECAEGIEPVARVNEGIYRLGIAPLLPAEHRVVLVSALDADTVRASYAEPAPSLGAALDEAFARHGIDHAPLLWRAGECVAAAL